MTSKNCILRHYETSLPTGYRLLLRYSTRLLQVKNGTFKLENAKKRIRTVITVMKIVICGDIVGLMVANCVLQIRRHIAVKQNFQLVYIERIGNGAV